ncbi:hypothetical protein, partial [Bacillus sp. RO1]|uniref:hypothetical protein n=1 Tax=Bacillus sp. RO1 TaxID=2722703 RepID=UPI00197BAD5E
MLISANGFAFLGADESLLGYAEATEKELDYKISLNTAGISANGFAFLGADESLLGYAEAT